MSYIVNRETGRRVKVGGKKYLELMKRGQTGGNELPDPVDTQIHFEGDSSNNSTRISSFLLVDHDGNVTDVIDNLDDIMLSPNSNIDGQQFGTNAPLTYRQYASWIFSQAGGEIGKGLDAMNTLRRGQGNSYSMQGSYDHE